MKKTFSETERNILSLFKVGTYFSKDGVKHKVIISGKPLVTKGECKTDIYLKTLCRENIEHEFKISLKLENADFLENKISIERAYEILGPNASNIIKNATLSISDKFIKHKLIEFKKSNPIIMIGWKFEFMNKRSGEKSGLMNLNQSQIHDIYSGKNLNEEKKNAKVNNILIKDSGVADYMLVVEAVSIDDSQYYINKLIKISDYIKTKKIYFACKALNFRLKELKWDGNRPLCVWVNWFVAKGKLYSKINFDKPLETKGNEIAWNIKNLLNELKLNYSNFEQEINSIYMGSK